MVFKYIEGAFFHLIYQNLGLLAWFTSLFFLFSLFPLFRILFFLDYLAFTVSPSAWCVVADFARLGRRRAYLSWSRSRQRGSEELARCFPEQVGAPHFGMIMAGAHGRLALKPPRPSRRSPRDKPCRLNAHFFLSLSLPSMCDCPWAPKQSGGCLICFNYQQKMSSVWDECSRKCACSR